MASTADYLIFVGTVGEGVWRSEDGGRTFARRSRGMFVECDIRALASHPAAPRVLFTGTSEGVYRTDDRGESWTRLDSPLTQLVTWSLLVSPWNPDTIFAGARPAGLFRSEDGGRGWTQLGATLAQHCNNIIYNRVTTIVADPDDAHGLWAGVEIDAVHHSTDGGASWARLEAGLSSLDIHGLALIPGPGSRRLLASTNNDLNVSTDEGRTWQPQEVSRVFDWPYCRGLAQKADDPNVLFLGNGDGPPGQIGALHRSADGGRSWHKAELPCVPNSTVWGFAIHPADPQRILAYTVSGEIYTSRDGGLNWDKLAREFGEIRALAWVPG
jgi:photosystem II stability/assembly factor-like uncharacterized protein